MADQDLALLEAADLLGRGHGDAQNDVGSPGGIGVAHIGSGIAVELVGVAGGLARA